MSFYENAKLHITNLLTIIYRWIRGIIYHLNSYKKWKELSNHQYISLELGSGPKKGINGWTTVDLCGSDINHDLRKGIPLPDGRVDRIYSSHMFEHIPYNELLKFINECHRVLKVGGVLSVCVPNSELYIQAYVKKENSPILAQGYEPARVDTGSYLDLVNYIAYMGGEHKYLFDNENLVNTLKKGGFNNANTRAFDPNIDLEIRRPISIYAEAYK